MDGVSLHEGSVCSVHELYIRAAELADRRFTTFITFNRNEKPNSTF